MNELEPTGGRGRLLWLCLLGLLLYVFAVWVRLESVQQVGLQSDERLWIARSHEELKRYRTDRRHITSHLPHPGATAATVMALGQAVREALNDRLHCSGDPGCEIHILDASRIAMILFVSMSIPVLFWGTLWLLGTGWAFVTAALVALDPRIIGYTRIAHIDGSLMLFVLITVLTYLYAVSKKSLFWKGVAGIAWGCCLLTKPTGALVLPILMLYRTARYVCMRGKVPLIRWREVWLIVLAHGVFVLGFTRLWDLHSFYDSRLKVHSPLARAVQQVGEYCSIHYQSQLLIAAFVLAFVLMALLFYWRRTGSRSCYHIAQLLGITAVVSTVLFLWPIVIRNLTLYWTWTSGLSRTRHEAFGHVLNESKAPGYAQIIAFEMPELPLVLFVFGVLFVFVLAVRERTERSCALLALVLAFFCWILFLSTSSKQAMRYALPVLPVVYIVGIAGLRRLLTLSGSRIVPALCAAGLLLVQAYTTYQWRPYFHTYFNRFDGGLAGAQERGRHYWFAGQKAAVEYLLSIAQKEERPLYVTVAGDKTTLQSVLKKNWPKTTAEVHFGHFSLGVADYVLQFHSHKEYLPAEYYPILDTLTPVFRVPFQNAYLIDIYALPALDFKKPVQLYLQRGHHMTGSLGDEKGQEYLRMTTARNAAGYAYFLEGLRVSPGTYTLTASGRIGADRDAAPLLQLEIGDDCIQKLFPKQVEADGEFTVSLSCTLKDATRLVPRVYWFGGTDLTIAAISIRESQ